MLRARLLFMVMFCMLAVLFGNRLDAGEFVPWQKGDNATFIDSFNNSSVVQVDGQIGEWVRFSNFAGFGSLWIMTSIDDEKVYFRTGDGKGKQLFVDFDEPVGTENVVDIQPCNSGNVVIMDKNVEVEIPAGKFEDAVLLGFETSCADGGVLSAWFVPGVGPVRWDSSNITGVVTSEMISTEIGDVELPQGLIVNASFPNPSIVIDMEPIVPPDRPVPTVRVFMTIKNNTGNALTYIFNSGQQFEISLINDEGVVVSRWSRGMAFTEAIETRELNNGQTWSFGGDVQLSSDDGSIVPGQNYTIRIEMTSAPNEASDHKPGGERIGVTIPVSIVIAL